ncbi:MAG: F0F1 ATP synthase subunit B [Acidimicrobiaceae bacterium]|nr:F0F1 ATP synthase subunit B [Acidimicrobiaceae bacterium]
MTPTFASVTSIKPATLLWTWGVFLVTLYVLSKIAWPMLVKKMEEREVRIAEGLQKAEDAEARARDLADRQEQILEETRREAQKLLAESHAAAENARNDMLAAAQQDIAAQRQRAKDEIGLERSRAVEELKRSTVELTLEASARLLQRDMRDADHERLAREVVEEVASRL